MPNPKSTIFDPSFFWQNLAFCSIKSRLFWTTFLFENGIFGIFDLFWTFFDVFGVLGPFSLKLSHLFWGQFLAVLEHVKISFQFWSFYYSWLSQKWFWHWKKSISVKKKSKRCVQNRCKPQAMSNFLLKNYSKRGWILMKSQIWTKTINSDCTNQGFENSIFLFFSALKKSE